MTRTLPKPSPEMTATATKTAQLCNDLALTPHRPIRSRLTLWARRPSRVLDAVETLRICQDRASGEIADLKLQLAGMQALLTVRGELPQSIDDEPTASFADPVSASIQHRKHRREAMGLHAVGSGVQR